MPAPEIVTLNEAKAWLRVDADDENATIQSLIDAATEAALEYADAFDPTAEPSPRMKLAILAHVSNAFRNRENPEAPGASKSLIQHLRVMDT